ncbi:MAG: putative Ig domain-containing protein [Melioribacteraceae bacterium]
MKSFKISVKKMLLLFAMLMLGTTLTFAQVVTLPSVTGKVGTTVTVPISVTGLGSNVKSYQFTLSYDNTKIDITGASNTGTISDVAGSLLQANPDLTNGKLYVAWASPTAITATSGNFINLTVSFKVAGTSALSVGTTFLFNSTQITVANGSATAATIEVSAGSVANAQKGVEVLIPINTSALVTADNVRSFNFTLTYDAAKLQILGNTVANALGVNGTTAENNTTAGTYLLSWASGATNPVTTAAVGALVFVRAKMLVKGSTDVTLGAFTYNAGTPAVVRANGTITAVNQAPVFGTNTTPLNVIENAAVSFTLVATDADTDPMTYAMTSPTLPTGANTTVPTFNTTTGAFSWTPGYRQAGTYAFVFTASDGSSTSDPLTISIIVANPVTTPTLLPNAPTSAVNGGSVVTFSLGGADVDVDNVLTYTVSPTTLAGSLAQPAVSTAGVFSWTPGFHQAGTFPFTVTVSNGTNTTTATLSLTVNNVNTVPSFTATGAAQMPDQTIMEGQTLTFTYKAVDAESDVINYYKTNPTPAASTIDASTGVFTWTPALGSAGTSQIVILASDGTLTATSRITTVIVTAAPAPTLTAVAPVTVAEKSVVSITLVGATTNPSGTPLVYSMSGAPIGSSLTAGVFTWTPDYGTAGTFNVTFKVTDNLGLTATQAAVITVTKKQEAPTLTLSPVGPYTKTEGQNLSVLLVGADLNPGDVSGLQYSFTPAITGATLSTAGVFSWTPTVGQAGTYTVTFTVKDADNLTGTAVANITVNAAQAPTLIFTPAVPVGGYTVAEQGTLTLTLSSTDPNSGQTAAYSVTGNPTGSSLSTAGVFTWTPGLGTVGTYNVTFKVTNSPLGLSATQTVVLTVTRTNVAPTLAAVAAVTASENQAVSFTLVGADANPGEVLTYSMAGNPTDATLNASTGAFAWTPGYDQAGSYSITFKVTDALGLFATVVAQFTINDVNRAPTLALNPAGPAFTVAEGAPFTLTLVGADLDTDNTLTYSMVTTPPSIAGAALSATGVFTWIPTYTQSGSYSIDFKVADYKGTTAMGTSATVTATITVSNTNRAPVFTATIPNGTVVAVHKAPNPVYYNFQFVGNDPDGQPVAYSLIAAPTGASITTDGLFTWAPTLAQAGSSYVISVQISDGSLTALYTGIIFASSTITAVNEYSGIPTEYVLMQNYPNPFNPTTSIKFGLPTESNVRLSVFNILGQEVALLVNQTMSAGFHKVNFDASQLTSGLYFYKVQAENFVQVKKMMLMK